MQLPESVTQSVFDRMTSERKVLADRFQYEGEAEAQQHPLGRRAQGGRDCWPTPRRRPPQIKGKGEAEAAKSLAVFQQNPELASFIFRLNALEELAEGTLDPDLRPAHAAV